MLEQYLIKVYPPSWGGCCALVRGDGETINQALKDASEGLGATFRPKQDGRTPILLNLAIEAPNGERFSISPATAKTARSFADLWAARVTL